MTNYICNTIKKKLSALKIQNLAFFGISYKKNCSQTSNSMYLKVALKLNLKYSVDIYDYMAKSDNLHLELKTNKCFRDIKYDAIVIGVEHNKYKKMKFQKNLNKTAFLIDIHGINLYSDNRIL